MRRVTRIRGQNESAKFGAIAAYRLPLWATRLGQNSTKNPEQDVIVKDGRLSLLGCCTTDTYEQMWTTEAVSIGFPNRLFIVGADRKCKVAWPALPNEERLATIRSELLHQLSRLLMCPEATANAKREWEWFYLGMPSSEHVKRLDTLGFRLLALSALTTGKTAIDLETVRTVRLILD